MSPSPEERCSSSGLQPFSVLSLELTLHYGPITCTIFPVVIKTHDDYKMESHGILPDKNRQVSLFCENRNYIFMQ